MSHWLKPHRCKCLAPQPVPRKRVISGHTHVQMMCKKCLGRRGSFLRRSDWPDAPRWSYPPVTESLF